MRRFILMALMMGLTAALRAQDVRKSPGALGPAPVLSQSPSKVQIGKETSSSIAALVEQLRKHPARPSSTVGRIGILLIDAQGGEATLIAEQTDPWLNRCGSPAWSHDGKHILFDVTPGNYDYIFSRLKGLELADDHLVMIDLGPGNCPALSPSGDHIVFLLNPGCVPGTEPGVWIMNPDGAGRRRLGGYGRPKWSQDGHQFLIVDFSIPCNITVIDDRPGNKSGTLHIPDQKMFSIPSWVGEGTIVAVLGEEEGETIALVDVSDPEQGRVKEVLYRQRKDFAAKLTYPAYFAASRRCVFVGEVEGKGKALYAFEHGKSDPPRRLESEGFDQVLQDPTFSPDGRHLVFSSDRPDRRRVSTRSSSVEAPALSGVTIDGDLKDWPPAMTRHSISNLQTFPPRTGIGGLEHAFFETSPDLSASFSIGYDPKEQLIYVAVIVRDDQLVVGNTSPFDTDAVEVYIDGLHSDQTMPWPHEPNWDENFDASEAPVLQYVGLPGKGPVYGVRKSAGVERGGEDNPILMFGDVKKTKTRMAFRRVGDVTTYEWAIQAFDHYPDKPTKLVAGMRLGFDLTVVDRDTPAQTPRAENDPESDRAAWISWGPPVVAGGFKSLNASNLGEIVLVRAPRP